MAKSKIKMTIGDAFKDAGAVVRESSHGIMRNPQVLVYPYIAIAFITLTLPVVSGLISTSWNNLTAPATATVNQEVPHQLRIILTDLSFSFFYTAFVSAYFTCAVSVGTLAALKGKPTPPLYGLRRVFRRFFRITLFALLAIFFFPLGIIAQRKKLAKGGINIIEVIGSSLTLHIPQLAPEIMSKNAGVLETIRNSVNTLGKAWRENLVIRIGMWICILLLGALSFLPKLIVHYWSDDSTSRLVGWLVTIFLLSVSYLTIKVISTVFITGIYYRVTTKKSLK